VDKSDRKKRATDTKIDQVRKGGLWMKEITDQKGKKFGNKGDGGVKIEPT
jgi:hypothetical protein